MPGEVNITLRKMNMAETIHVPVMLADIMENLPEIQQGTIIDATLGGGGYTRALRAHYDHAVDVIAIDTDRVALDRFEQNQPVRQKGITLYHGNYSEIESVCHVHEVSSVALIVADLGLSSDQIESSERGFAFMHDGPLDMRMDQDGGITAQELIAQSTPRELALILSRYGDVSQALHIAHVLKDNMQTSSTREMATILKSNMKIRHGQKIHPATQVFQALRIAVNDEYAHLEKFLRDGIRMLAAKGQFMVVTFHSGEDRIVKNVFREHTVTCVCPPALPMCACDQEATVKIVNKKPLTPRESEIADNPRSRSAKLRIIEKI